MTFPDLFQAIEERRELMHAASDKAVHAVEDLDKLDDEIAEMLHIHDLYEIHDTTPYIREYHQLCDEIATLHDQTWDIVAEHEHKVIEQLREALHDLHHDFEHIVEYHSQITVKMHVVDDSIHDLEDLIDEKTHKLSMAFADTIDHMAELSHQIKLLADDTKAKVDEFGSAVGNEIFTTFDDSMTQMREMVDDIMRKRLPSASSKFIAQTESTFDFMNQVVMEAGDNLNDFSSDLMTYMMDFVEMNAMRPIEDMFDRLNKEGLDRMAKTLEDCSAIMSTGAHVTEAIAPWLPAFKNIKEMVAMVQETQGAA